jgi:deferrochelatase/peroxidase EfeB
VSVALSFQGLKALGVPQESLDSFSTQFQQGMAARAKVLGDSGESSPAKWERPLGSADVHVVLTAISKNAEHLESALERASKTYQELRGVTAIWRQDCYAAPDEKEAFGFKDGISHPAMKSPIGLKFRNPTFWDATGAMSSSESYISTWPRSANT